MNECIFHIALADDWEALNDSENMKDQPAQRLSIRLASSTLPLQGISRMFSRQCTETSDFHW